MTAHPNHKNPECMQESDGMTSIADTAIEQLL